MTRSISGSLPFHKRRLASSEIVARAFKNPILNKEHEDDKLSGLNILATDERGPRLTIEMQTSWLVRL
jgi:hypothetical protein